MRIQTHCLTGKFLRQFMELRDIEPAYLEAALEKGELVVGDSGDKLTDCLLNDPFAIFLLQGKVECRVGLLKKTHIASDTPDGLRMLNTHLVKNGSIIASTDNTAILKVKKKEIGQARAFSKKPLADKDSRYNVIDLNEKTSTDDWMSMLLTSPLFLHLTPQSIQKLFSSFSENIYKKDDIVIRAGEHDHFFYVIKSGTAKVILNGDRNSDILLKPGHFFGEGALVGETVHSATIQMVTDGVVCSITEEQFEDLLINVLLHFINYQAMEQEIAANEESVLLVDVRHPVEYRHGHYSSSINIPINKLRDKLKSMGEDRPTCYILHGDDARSQLAAMLFIAHGFKTLLVNNSTANK